MDVSGFFPTELIQQRPSRDHRRRRSRRSDDDLGESDDKSDSRELISSGKLSSKRSRRCRRGRERDSDGSYNSDSNGSDELQRGQTRNITDEDIAKYMAERAQRKAMKVAKKLKSQTVSGYSNDSNPFGDSNLNEKFVWRKKIERDVTQGVPLDVFSVKAEKEKQRARMAEIEKLKKRKEERALERAQREEERALLARERARAEFQEDTDWEKKLEEDWKRMNGFVKAMTSKPAPSEDHNFEIMEEGDAVFGSGAEVVNLQDSQVYWWHDKYRPRKPKYFNRVHTGYEWNKYNHTHYDHHNPPPKIVQGYKFNIFYDPDLINVGKGIRDASYTIDKDGNSNETCIIRFHAGPPYEYIAFRIVNKEWDYSHNKGFKCTFQHGMLRLYFNFKRHPYRRKIDIELLFKKVNFITERSGKEVLRAKAYAETES